MDFTVLGKTGLKVSIMGFGCGGPSRAGRSYGKSESDSVGVLREALESGINFVDTAEAYETETAVGKALRETGRDGVILSTKKSLPESLTPQQVAEGLEASLSRLGTDYIDVYHLHGLDLARYQFVIDEIVPVLIKLRDQGKIRYLGVTERFGRDLQHAMLQRALQDDIWDVVMVGFNMLNQSARHTVFPLTLEKNVGVLIMFAVRRALSRTERLRAVIDDLTAKGLLDADRIDPGDPLGFLVHEGGAVSVPDAAYRFCRYEPGVHVVLSGTGNPEHLRDNIASLTRPPLPEADTERINSLFAGIDCVSGN